MTGSVEWQRWSCDMHLVVTDTTALAEAREQVDGELDAVEMAASRFRPDSEVCSLARAAGERVAVSPVLADLVEAALGAARYTDGDVDPTVGRALVDLGYDRDIGDIGAVGAVGAVGASTVRLASVSVPARWTDVDFDGRHIRMPAGTLLDLGATAKAVAADRCARRAHAATGAGVLVNLGGDIATAGSAPEGGWQITVQDVDDDPASRVAIGGDAGLATSSTRRRQWWRAGEAYHHIVDPRTGAPADPVWSSVSVAAHTCLAANTVSTASIVRGHQAPEWVAALGVSARFVGRDGTVRTVGGWPA